MEKKKLSIEEKKVVEQFIVPFFHAKKIHSFLPGKDSILAEAELLGIEVEELRKYRENLDQNAKQAALELMKEEAVSDNLEKLPFDGEETIVGFGDSSTEDAQGWFTIFKHLLELYYDTPNFNFVNSGVSYNTTSEALKRLDRDVLMHEPDWVFVSLGTFDTQRLNIAPQRTLLPLSETWENLNTVHEVLQQEIDNPTIWITPAPVISELLEENPLYEFKINHADLDQVQQLVSGKSGGIVDPKSIRMGEKQPDAWNYLSDGLNPSLSGHTNTVREILKTLVEVAIKS